MRWYLGFLLFSILSFGPAVAEDAVDPVGRELSTLFKDASTVIDVEPPKAKAPKPATVGGRTLSVRAYSYCLRGRTASGRYTKHGIIAVDPRVIPLGTKMYVPGYGWGIAADTGGAIKGNKIDLWMPTRAQCYKWGVRRVDIKVFPREPG